MNIFRFAIAFALLLACEPAVAQYQVPNHSVPIGRGSGVTGYGNAAPGVAGMPVVSNGTSADPSFRPVPNSGLVSGPAGTVKGSTDGVIVTDSPLFTLLNATCNSIPTACTAFLGYVSPLWYGAKCDGGTHDETAFQNALNAAISARSPLHLPPNQICVMNASIVDGSSLFTDTIIVGSGQTSQITFLGSNGFQFSAPNSYYILKDFQINCSALSTVACLSVFNGTGGSTAYGSVFQRLAINGCGIVCVFFQNLVQAKFLDNTILSSAASGTAALYIDNNQTSDVGGNFITGNFIVNVAGSTTHGMYLQEFGGSHVSDNSVDGYDFDITYALASSNGSTGILLRGNQLDDCRTACINFSGGSSGGFFIHVDIIGNTMHSAQGSPCPAFNGYGIFFNPSAGIKYMQNVSVTGNTIDTCQGAAGISLSDTAGLSVVGNTIRDAAGGVAGNPAIQINNASAGVNGCVVTGNAATEYTVTLSNLAGCVAAGNTSP